MCEVLAADGIKTAFVTQPADLAYLTGYKIISYQPRNPTGVPACGDALILLG